MSIEMFFSAWSEADADKRQAIIESAVASDVTYKDPRTPEPITGPAALSEYVGMYTAAAPGATATVTKTEVVDGKNKAVVAFRMADGMEQMGHYFFEPQSGPLAAMTGFVGAGDDT